MSYGDFTFEDLLGAFGLAMAQLPLFGHAARVEPTPWLRDALERGRSAALFSDKSRSEFIVAPILLTCKELVGEDCSLYSGVRLDVDPERGLKGECDFILGRCPPVPALRAPLLVVIEAKKNDIEEGLPQCAAQMLGARRFNEVHGTDLPAIYGCVTTGEAWQFLCLTGSQLAVDADRYYITDVSRILGVLVAILRG